MARISTSTGETPLSEPITEGAAAKGAGSDGRIDSMVAQASLADPDEPIPDHLMQLALKLSRALDGER